MSCCCASLLSAFFNPNNSAASLRLHITGAGWESAQPVQKVPIPFEYRVGTFSNQDYYIIITPTATKYLLKTDLLIGNISAICFHCIGYDDVTVLFRCTRWTRSERGSLSPRRRQASPAAF